MKKIIHMFLLSFLAINVTPKDAESSRYQYNRRSKYDTSEFRNKIAKEQARRAENRRRNGTTNQMPRRDKYGR